VTPRRILITGSAGLLGSKLRAHLAGRYESVLIDRVAPDGETVVADLGVWDERWARRFEGVEAVVHLAGNPVAYADWPELIGPNVDAAVNVFAAAERAKVRRVVFASSNHVMGGYQDEPGATITTDLPPKPGLRYVADGAGRFSGPYAATKLFGERLAANYASRGFEAVAVRYGWVWKGVNQPDALPAERGDWFRSMWLSDGDFFRLTECCLTATLADRFTVVNGMSANAGMRWDLTATERAVGYRPRDGIRS
jgi:NAD+ dependent glucose-6-phosphate dehydrogenase